MNTTTEEEFDYEAYLEENPPDLTNINRGTAAREKRLEAAITRILQEKQSESHDKAEK